MTAESSEIWVAACRYREEGMLVDIYLDALAHSLISVCLEEYIPFFRGENGDNDVETALVEKSILVYVFLNLP